MSRHVRWTASVLAVLLLIGFGARAEAQNLRAAIGQAQFGAGATGSVIRVERGRGALSRLQIEVGHGRLWVEALRVVYDTGNIEMLRVGRELVAGHRSPVYELGGFGRRVDSVEIVGEAGPVEAARTLVRLYADSVDDEHAGRARAAWLTSDGEAGAPPRVTTLGRSSADSGSTQSVLTPTEPLDGVSAIRVRVQGAPVVIRSVVTVRKSGVQTEHPVDMTLMPGDATRLITLGDEDLKNVVVLFAARTLRRAATVELEGVIPALSGPRRPDRVPEGWVLLGAATGLDRDSIAVGAQSGRYRAIALRVEGGNVTLKRISIAYADGRRDSYPVDKEIPDGTFTPGIKLKGSGEIDRVEMIYSGGDPEASIEVWGQGS